MCKILISCNEHTSSRRLSVNQIINKFCLKITYSQKQQIIVRTRNAHQRQSTAGVSTWLKAELHILKRRNGISMQKRRRK